MIAAPPSSYAAVVAWCEISAVLARALVAECDTALTAPLDTLARAPLHCQQALELDSPAALEALGAALRLTVVHVHQHSLHTWVQDPARAALASELSAELAEAALVVSALAARRADHVAPKLARRAQSAARTLARRVPTTAEPGVGLLARLVTTELAPTTLLGIVAATVH